MYCNVHIFCLLAVSSPDPLSCDRVMEVTLPKHTMYDGELLRYVEKLQIPDFRGVKMRDELPPRPHHQECGVLNFNTHLQRGSHWVCWYKNGNERYYFDSFGEPPPFEMMTYLKTDEEMRDDSPVIRRSAVTVQHYESNECGSLCLFVLKLLSENVPFSQILETLLIRYEHPHPLVIKV